MRVYVAGPVTGRPRRNLAMFEHAAKQLVQAGHVPVVPHRHVPAQAEWHVAMRRWSRAGLGWSWSAGSR